MNIPGSKEMKEISDKVRRDELLTKIMDDISEQIKLSAAGGGYRIKYGFDGGADQSERETKVKTLLEEAGYQITTSKAPIISNTVFEITWVHG